MSSVYTVGVYHATSCYALPHYLYSGVVQTIGLGVNACGISWVVGVNFFGLSERRFANECHTSFIAHLLAKVKNKTAKRQNKNKIKRVNDAVR